MHIIYQQADAIRIWTQYAKLHNYFPIKNIHTENECPATTSQ